MTQAQSAGLAASTNGTAAGVDVGSWGIPDKAKRSGKVGHQATELNATAEGQHEHPGEFRVIQRCSSAPVARARASTLRRKLKERASGQGTALHGLAHPADRFEIKTTGELVWARFNP